MTQPTDPRVIRKITRYVVFGLLGLVGLSALVALVVAVASAFGATTIDGRIPVSTAITGFLMLAFVLAIASGTIAVLGRRMGVSADRIANGGSSPAPNLPPARVRGGLWILTASFALVALVVIAAIFIAGDRVGWDFNAVVADGSGRQHLTLTLTTAIIAFGVFASVTGLCAVLFARRAIRLRRGTGV